MSNKTVKIQIDTAIALAVAPAVNHAIATVGLPGLMATSMFPGAAKHRELKRAA